MVVIGMMYAFLWLTEVLKSDFTACGVRKFTGFHCPGCGGTRCAQSIASGNWLQAMGYNTLLMSGFIIFMVLSAYLIVRMTLLGKPAPKMPNIKPRWIWFGVAAVVVFSIARNIPAYPFTLLAP